MGSNAELLTRILSLAKKCLVGLTCCKQRSFYYIFNNNILTYHNKIVGSTQVLALVILSPSLEACTLKRRRVVGVPQLASDRIRKSWVDCSA
jgi:hypothetical protein